MDVHRPIQIMCGTMTSPKRLTGIELLKENVRSLKNRMLQYAQEKKIHTDKSEVMILRKNQSFIFMCSWLDAYSVKAKPHAHSLVSFNSVSVPIDIKISNIFSYTNIGMCLKDQLSNGLKMFSQITLKLFKSIIHFHCAKLLSIDSLIFIIFCS